MVHRGTQNIRTDRLLLRKLVMNDAISLHSFGALGGTQQESNDIMKNMIADYDKLSYYHWGIEYENIIIGRVKEHQFSEAFNSMELAYGVVEAYRNRGIMTEAIKAIINFLIKEVEVNRVYVLISTQNIASNKVVQKAGMLLDGCLREHYKNGDDYVDMNVYSTIKKDLANCNPIV